MKNTVSLLILLSTTFCFSQTQSNYDVTAANGNGFRFWNGSNSYKIHMGNTSEYRYGPVTDYSIKTNMNNTAGRGWTWGIPGQTPIAALNNQGKFQIASDFYALGNIGLGTSTPDSKFSLYVPGSTTTYPTVSTKGDVLQSLRSNNNGIEIGNARSTNARRAWILARHGQVGSYGKYYSTLHLQPDVGDKSQYRGVALGYSASTILDVGTHLAINGKTGVGIANPMSKLHVFEGASGRSPHGFTDLAIEDDDNVMLSLMTPNNKTAYYGFADADDDFVGGIMYVHSSDKMTFRVNNHASDMVIDNSGRVGIGTTAPGKKLDVSGEIRSLDGSDRMGLKVDEANSVSEIHWGDDTNDRLRFYYNYWNGTANDKEVMTLLANGNVGIGTATPDVELAVNGNIHAKEVKVDLDGWPDYVFEEDYHLPTLEEVERHIKEKGHLINIPSAKEVEENGVQLGEMNKLLLEKIEELTLYTLQQEKELQEQKKINQGLQQRLAKLEKLITD